MAEPQLNRFLNRLADAEFVKSWSHYEDLAPELLWYLDCSRTQTVVAAIKNRDEKNRRVIIDNIARLYPLSACLLEELLNEIRHVDENFARCFQNCSSVLNQLTKTIAEIKNDTRLNTYEFHNLEEKVARLQKDVDKISPKIKDYEELEKRKAELEARKAESESAKRVKILKTEIDALESELGELEASARNLESQLAKKKADRAKYNEQTASLLNELKTMESFATEEQRELWRRLEASFPSDALERMDNGMNP